MIVATYDPKRNLTDFYAANTQLWFFRYAPYSLARWGTPDRAITIFDNRGVIQWKGHRILL